MDLERGPNTISYFWEPGMKTFEYFRPVRVDAMKAVRDLGYLVETRAFVSGSLGWNFSCNSVVLVGVISGGAGDLERN